MISDAYPDPLDVLAVRGAVVVVSSHTTTAITPAAALETAERLTAAAHLAASDQLPPEVYDYE